ncbi:2-oxo-4-hydroxy-4-carboxy-5-ureidoimidazoline decarboxylase [Candidatus Pantoea symbiotica]|uniref:2-oxo-4-hydroxy-4-carboxy-5-ureidoimidazoline decarboxylase n=1 Tax=Candidatus Pantoea symbiotica TaxID=1884370 RepID=A0A1I4E2Z9_9GAMM|nr:MULTISPECIES: 2-oxo-4-hydroxy-4-carboxy-5-ureidoimidazoline decarboxylase [Pantoea]KAJ9434114.1 2-oxo-4-hydroxy-4-carboxy-5-ureidoimidazoline decarboxylase [Pantoea sp. YR343]MRT27061.1 2-oxo-4-hydroxy-4-carboxy-5-ureidoimidazoline decarboxylase [Enterobacteriaceae bacterium RIT697]SFK99539.1 2-oxo-4-hydroxy-4-carboxy-5-ureidoimidazoline decarboxylase [Pantoea symbiotica]SFV07028.1 2-oxo-4-hydroxy-4-carboxy-5-ureidoimidazoline decarboxylase [Pantoea sp. YR525]
MDLVSFNQLSPEAAQTAIAHCVAIPGWQQALVAARPYADVAALQAEADRLAQFWQAAELEQALSAHPRIGDKVAGADKEATLSRSEQSAMQQTDGALQLAMLAGNQTYEQRFGRVFLIRAKGRSGEEMLAELQRRLNNDAASEQREALAQLREITLLRLKESIT